MQALRTRPPIKHRMRGGNTAAIAIANTGTTIAAARTGNTGRQPWWKPEGTVGTEEVRPSAVKLVGNVATMVHAHYSMIRCLNWLVQGHNNRLRRQFTVYTWHRAQS